MMLPRPTKTKGSFWLLFPTILLNIINKLEHQTKNPLDPAFSVSSLSGGRASPLGSPPTLLFFHHES